MSTRRERLETKLERREEWAGKASAASQAYSAAAQRILDVIPPGQPILVGHHSEHHHRRDLARIDSAMGHAVERYQMSNHHASKADGLARQLDRSIFSDDADAIEALEERIRGLEAKRDAMKAANSTGKLPLCNYDVPEVVAVNKYHGTQDLRLEKVNMTKAEYAAIHTDYKGTQIVAGSHRVRCAMIRHNLCYVFLTDSKVVPPLPPASTSGAKPYADWEVTNLGAEIRRNKQRIEEVKARKANQAEADKSPNGVIIRERPEHNWCSVIFAEKPDREVLDALRAAGYGWGSGSWSGHLDRLPQIVRDLLPTALAKTARNDD